MELEFDKEMDAILRKARDTRGAAAAPEGTHLDADAVAAFVENALPDNTKLLYVRHLADCDNCRKKLSFAAAMNETPVVEAAPSRLVEAGEAAIPWYQAIFRTPNLAAVMGGLILVFSGVLGYLVIQNNRESQNAVVTQVTEQEAPQASIFGADPEPTVNANVVPSGNIALPAAPEPGSSATSTPNVAGATGTTATGSGSGSGSGVEAGKAVGESRPTFLDDNSVSSRQATELPRIAAAPPPPPAAVTESTADALRVERDEAKIDPERRQAERSDLSLEARQRSATQMPSAAAKRSGPRQVQTQTNQIGANARQMTASRSVGGKSFNNRDGAWYDTAYSGQATTNVRRGSDEFKKLDSGLRSIAGQIEGVVVVLWKAKAYRIQ